MIIGFVGKKQSGKSTACSIVENDLPDVRRVNMKDALVAEMKKNFPRLLREVASTVYPTSALTNFDEEVDRLFVEKPALMRTLLQEYGTEVRRGDRDSYWVDKWRESAMIAKASGFHIVVDDVRFLNEAQAVKDLGGYIVRIHRQDLVSTDTHASEMEMDEIKADYIISVGPGEFEKLTSGIRLIYANEMPD